MNMQYVVALVLLSIVLLAFVAALFILIRPSAPIAQPQLELINQILRFLATIGAGLAAFFFAGGLIADGQIPLPEGGSIAFKTGGGFAMALAVWFFWEAKVTKLLDGIRVVVPEGATFGACVRIVAKAHQLVAVLNGFSEAQLNSPLLAQPVHAKSIEAAIGAIGGLANPPLPKYSVAVNGPNIEVTLL